MGLRQESCPELNQLTACLLFVAFVTYPPDAALTFFNAQLGTQRVM